MIKVKDLIPLDASYRVKITEDFSKIRIDDREYAIANVIPVFDCLFIHFDIKRMLRELGIPEEDVSKASDNFSANWEYLERKAFKILRDIYKEAKVDYYLSLVDRYINIGSSIEIDEISATTSGFKFGFYVPYEPAPISKIRSPVKPEFLEISLDTNYVIMTPSAMTLLSWIKKNFVDFMKDKYGVIIEVGTQSLVGREIREIEKEIEVEEEVIEIAEKNLYSFLEKEYVHKNKGIIVSAVIVPIAYVKDNLVLSGKITYSLPDFPIKTYQEIWRVAEKPKDQEKAFPDYYAYISAYGTALYIKKSKGDEETTKTEKPRVFYSQEEERF